ncbi:MAG: hypothetical protein R2849_11930 [Thermomicrobiales bacterium]
MTALYSKRIEPGWLDFWKEMGPFDEPEHIFSHPDFYWSEGQVLAVGRVPHEG